MDNRLIFRYREVEQTRAPQEGSATEWMVVASG